MKTPKRLIGQVQVANSATTYYTVPAATKTVVRQLNVFNPSGSAVTFTFAVGTSAGASNRIYDAISIPAASALGGPGGVWFYLVLEATEVLSAFASVATTLVMYIDGDEYTLG